MIGEGFSGFYRSKEKAYDLGYDTNKPKRPFCLPAGLILMYQTEPAGDV